MSKESQPDTKPIFGPDIYERDSYGLLKNVDYIFNEDGSVNWRAMVKPEFLYPNKDWFLGRQKDVPDSVDGLEDHQLLINLAGLKELAKLRGFKSVKNIASFQQGGYVTAECEIVWIENYETPEVTFLETANATSENTDLFYSKFLETIACNRAFTRCVRNFLNIHIVSDEEIDQSAPSSQAVEETQQTDITPTSMLKSAVKNLAGNASFDSFKEVLRTFWKDESYRNESAKDWKDYSDIPVKDTRRLLALFKKKLDAK